MSTPIAGQIVRVTTKQDVGGEALRSPFIVAEPDPAKAEDIVRAATAADDEVKAVCPFPAANLARFKLKRGEFTPWREEPQQPALFLPLG